jgi:hypothetical protein
LKREWDDIEERLPLRADHSGRPDRGVRTVYASGRESPEQDVPKCHREAVAGIAVMPRVLKIIEITSV